MCKKTKLLLLGAAALLLFACHNSVQQTATSVSVVLTGPQNNVSVQVDAQVTIAGSASCSSGTITNVDCYVSGTKIDQTSAAVFSFTWTPTSPGSYSISVKAYGSNGDSATSSTIEMRVLAPEVPAILPNLQSGAWYYSVSSNKTIETSTMNTPSTINGVFELDYAGIDSASGAEKYTTKGTSSYNFATIPASFLLSYANSVLSISTGSTVSWSPVLKGPSASPWSNGSFIFVQNVGNYTGSGNMPFSCAQSMQQLFSSSYQVFTVSSSFDNLSDQYAYIKYNVSASQSFVPGLGIVASTYSWYYSDQSETFSYTFETGSCTISLIGFKITTTNGQTISGGSSPQTQAPSAAPSTLVASTKGAADISLSWTDSAINDASILIERKETSPSATSYAQIASISSASTSFDDTSVSADSAVYSYRIRSSNANGDSDYSNEAASQLFSLPASPSITSSSSATHIYMNPNGSMFMGTLVTVNFTNPATNSDQLTIEWAPGTSGPWTSFLTVASPATGSGSTSTVDPNFNNSSVIIFRAYNTNKFGNSAYSANYYFKGGS